MTIAVTQQTPSGVRCSDADRERTSERLRVAAGEGCLTMEELSDRLADVYAARYTHDLDGLVVDLPAATRPRTAVGWRAVLAMALAQLGADLSLLLGRGGVGWSRRRVVIAALVALIAGLFIGGVILSAFHGFGDGGGFGHRGFGPEGDGPGRGF